MKLYKVILSGGQYAMLEKMLCSERAGQLAKNQYITLYALPAVSMQKNRQMPAHSQAAVRFYPVTENYVFLSQIIQ